MGFKFRPVSYHNRLSLQELLEMCLNFSLSFQMQNFQLINHSSHREFTHCVLSTYHVLGAEKREVKDLSQASNPGRRPTSSQVSKSSLPIKAQSQSVPPVMKNLHWYPHPVILCPWILSWDLEMVLAISVSLTTNTLHMYSLPVSRDHHKPCLTVSHTQIKFSLFQTPPCSTAPLAYFLYFCCLPPLEGIWVLNPCKMSLKGLNLAHTHCFLRTLIRNIYKKPTANNIPYDEKLKASPVRLGTRQGCLLSSLLFNIVLKVLAKTIRQEKEIKVHRLGRKKQNSVFTDDMTSMYKVWNNNNKKS